MVMVAISSTVSPLLSYLSLSLIIKLFVPSILFLTLMICFTSPPLLHGIVVELGGSTSIVMYFGTAAWNTSETMSTSVEFVKLTEMSVFCASFASVFEQMKLMFIPAFANALIVVLGVEVVTGDEKMSPGMGACGGTMLELLL